MYSNITSLILAVERGKLEVRLGGGHIIYTTAKVKRKYIG